MKRTIQRRIIIRADQFKKLSKRALKYDADIDGSLYDRAWVEPLHVKEVEHHWTLALLKNPDLAHCDHIKYFLQSNRLFDQDYVNRVRPQPEDDEHIWVWPKNRHKKVIENWPDQQHCEKMLVWGVFEKDLP